MIRAWWRRRRLMCPEVARTLQSYLDGRNDERWATRVAEHLEDCRRCGLKADTYRQIKEALRRREPDIPPGTLEQLRSFTGRLAAGDIPPDHDQL